MNPNNRFRRKPKVEEDFYIYDIEEQSKNILDKKRLNKDNEREQKKKFQSLELNLVKRLIAFVVDFLIGTIFLFILCLIISLATILGVFQGDSYDVYHLISTIGDWSWVFSIGLIFFTEVNMIFCLLVTLSQIIFIALFFAFFESSKKQATLGKRVVGLVVISENCKKLGYDQSFKRNFLKFLLFPSIGLFLEEKRAFHNSWTKTLIIKNNEVNKIIGIN